MSRTKTLRLPKNAQIPVNVLEQIKREVNPTEIVHYDNHITHEVYTQQRRKNHEDRRDSYALAFEYLIKARTPYNFASENAQRQLFAYARYYKKKNADFTQLKTSKVMKPVLVKYLQHLIGLLTDVCQWEHPLDFEEARDWLNEAEQFLLMRKARNDIATVIAIPLEETIYALKWEKNIPFYDDLFVQELKKIKARHAPLSPAWFRKLMPVEKSYFAKLPLSIVSADWLVTSIQSDLQSFMVLWNKFKEDLGIRLEEALQSLRDTGTYSLISLTTYHSWPERYKVLLQYSASRAEVEKHITQSLEEKDQRLLDHVNALQTMPREILRKELQCIADLPLWYLELPEIQQYFLRKNLQDVEKAEDAVMQLGSRTRTFCGALSNHFKHKVMAWHQNGTVLGSYKERKRNSHPAPRNLLHFQELVDEHTRRNLDIMLRDTLPNQKLFYGSLISSVKLIKWLSTWKDYVPEMFAKQLDKLPPDHALQENLERSIRMHPEAHRINTTNHSMNVAKIPNATNLDSNGIQSLINVAQPLRDASPALGNLLNVYKKLLTSGWGSASWNDYIGRELCFGGMDQILATEQGMEAVGSCVSGKDREGLILILIASMLIFHSKYGKWPINLNNQKVMDPAESKLFIDMKERAIFVHIFCCILHSGHQQEAAALNAPGTPIQNAHCYLPQDIIDESERRLNHPGALAEESEIATYNELHKLVKEKGPRLLGLAEQIAAFSCPADKIQVYSSIALACSSEEAQAFIDKLHKYIHEKRLFEVTGISNKRYKSNSFFSSSSSSSGDDQQSEVITALRHLIKVHTGFDKKTASPQLLLAEIFAVVDQAADESNQHAMGLCQLIRSFCINKDRPITDITRTIDALYRQYACRNESIMEIPFCSDGITQTVGA